MKKSSPDLRIPGIDRGTPVTIKINGHPCRAFTHESVHAALLAKGHMTLRRHPKTKQPRGIFCGMGICYECLVTINGKPEQRACMRRVEDRMEIEIDDAQG